MKFSVIIPCHNAGPWIEAALGSVAAQTHQPHEVIVVDDGSTDDSVQRVERTQVASHLLKVNHRNAAATRNAGIDAASGEWVAFLDSDNWWLPEHLEQAAHALRSDGVVAYMAHRAILQADGVSKVVPEPPIRTLQADLTDDDFVAWLSEFRYGFGTTGFVMHRERVRTVGGFDATQKRRHDWELFSRVVHGHRWAFDPKPRWIKRQPREGDISSDQVRCKYFMLRGVIKMNRLYKNPRLERFIPTLARHAISAALLEGNASQVAEAVDLGWRWLPVMDRLALSGARYCPPARMLMRARQRSKQA